ncbi:MAG TPA: hypothetical protein VII83_06070 [Gaiellaceae bacterium]
MTLSHALRIPLAAVALVAIAAVVVPSAAAEISGPCEATINGQSVKDQGTGALDKAITVENDAVVPVTMSAGSQISHLKIRIEFAGLGFTVRDKASHGNSWSSDVKVKNYAKYGVGLYKVIGSSSGGVSCSGSALVKVKGNPLTTVAGIVGLIAALGGIAGVAGALVAASHAGAMGFGKSLLGLLSGLVGGLGLAVLLQQFALVYPTPAATAVCLGGGSLVGIGLTLLGKILGSGAAAAAG